MPDRLKNSLRKFSHPVEGMVNTDLSQNQPDIDPRFGGEPEPYPAEPASGIAVSGPSRLSKITVKHQDELAKTLPPYPQREFPLTVKARKRP
jgi:hypothetical protein